MQIEFTQPIYSFDIDSGQHVSNISYIKWLEIGRLKLLEAVGLPMHKIHEIGFFPVLTKTEISYRIPLQLGENARVVMWISELKRISATMMFKVFNSNNELAAEATQHALFINAHDQRPYKLPPEDRARFEPYVAK